jgi:hypothetical protein
LPNIKAFKGLFIRNKNTNILNSKIYNILKFLEFVKEYFKFQTYLEMGGGNQYMADRICVEFVGQEVGTQRRQLLN